MKFALKLFNFKGSPVYLKFWFLLLFLFLTPSMVIAVFISILIHELAHAYWANKLGYNVNRIYIDLFNGGTEVNLNQIPENDLLKIIGAGPIINLVLGLISYGVYIISNLYGFSPRFILDMALINGLFFVFNILPIFPMDGGRLLRDSLFLKMRRKPNGRRRAKKISDYVSLGFSIGLLGFSIAMFSLLMGLFSLIFIYYAVKELGWVK